MDKRKEEGKLGILITKEEQILHNAIKKINEIKFFQDLKGVTYLDVLFRYEDRFSNEESKLLKEFLNK